MRVPLSWLRDYVELPDSASGRDVAAKLIAAGLEVETVDASGADLSGPLVVGSVLSVEELTEFKKPIRWCQVDIGNPEPQSVICGATNFTEGDLVVVVVPGAVLPGGFEITARKTYGRVSKGMICSERELGMGDDHAGIIVLPPGSGSPGDDAIELLGLRDEVLDIAVTPDRGYALSMRGVAREAATAFGVAFRDPADIKLPEPVGEAWPAEIADATACDRFVLREVTSLDPSAPTPIWMRRRLQMAGIRPISLAVDVTNYVMHELGQPLHAFDRSRLSGAIVVRRARAGERLETLDHVVRSLHPEDILITDQSGPISLAGTMGGLHTEISDQSTDMVIEGAHFPAAGTARMSRRHKLSSEASRRFERGVDPELPLVATHRAAELLAELGHGRAGGGLTHVDAGRPATVITIPADHPDRVAGMAYDRGVVVQRLRDVGCSVEGGDVLAVAPPSWRPDLRDPNDLAEEVIRLEGYENIPVHPPLARAGRGLTPRQRLHRRVGRALAGAGYTEVLAYPFVSAKDWDDLRLPADDARRLAILLANPLSEDEPLLRTTLLPGLLRTVARNVGRGFPDVALFEMGLVYRPRSGAPLVVPRLGVDRGPTADEVASIEAALPDQPLRVAAVLTGIWERDGWWGRGRAAEWADVVEAARLVAREAGAAVAVQADRHAPWHPGRCAALYVGEALIGHAGELHPRVIEAYGLPARTCAVELELSRLSPADPVEAPTISTYPVALLDVALVVSTSTPVADVEVALREGAGALLEDLRLFDVYMGAQVGEGNKSLAYTLRFRAPDRTLTAEETTAIRDAAVAEATRRTGAQLRGT